MWKKIGFDPSELGDTTRDFLFFLGGSNGQVYGNLHGAISHQRSGKLYRDLFWLDFFLMKVNLMMEKHETDIGRFFIVLEDHP